MTKFKPLIICILIAFIGEFTVSINAQQNQIFVITTFDYPGAGNSTTPAAINERGDIVGDYVDSSNGRRGFRRRIDGTFSTIVAPGDTGNFTRARGINNSRRISGDFFTLATNTFHGSVFRPGDETWYLLNSVSNSFRAQHFGIATDKNQ